jgi:lysophospholipase L1-like esterase
VRGAWTLLATAIPLALLIGCGGGEEGRGAATPARTETHPFGPTPSDAPRPKPGAPIVAALGDSITAGSPLWDPDPEVRGRNPDALNPQSQYEYWAQARLGGRLRFRNCGVLGQTTSQIADRFAACTRGARGVVIQGGINDIVQRRPVERAAGELRAMVRRARARGLAVVLAEVLPWNNGYPKAVPAIERLNGLIDRIGREEGVQVLRFHRALEDPRSPGRMREDLTLEGDHPSVPGYRRLGELVAVAPPIVRLAAPES